MVDATIRNEGQNRNAWLNALRGLAAVAVTLFHLNEPIAYTENLYRDVVKFGRLGVIVFFVLSGYFIHSAAVRSPSAGLYLWRRLTRILPPYWASVILVGVVCVARKLTVGVNDFTVWPRDLRGWAATLTAMVHPATSTHGVSWVYWTLAYELAFYAVTVVAVSRPRSFPYVVVALTLLSMYPLVQDCVEANQQVAAVVASLPRLYFLPYWPIYGLGVGLSLVAEGRRFAAAAVLISCSTAVAVNFPLPVGLASVGTALFIGVSAWLPTPATRLGPLTRLGEISYSLYLIHVPIGCWLLLRWKVGGWADTPAWNATYDGVVVACCVFVAWAFYRFVERPSIRLGRTAPWTLRPAAR